MKMKNKGKIHPSPASHTPQRGSLSVLSFLPATILTLINILSVQDKETLAYMLTRSLNFEPKNKKNKILATHTPPIFDCDCFECYTNYWSKWDNSENKEIIHQAIEAFEESLSISEKQRIDKRGKKKEKQRKLTKVSSAEGSKKVETLEVGSPVDEALLEVAGVADVASASGGVSGGNRGLARKVLPDVMGIIGSRLFNLWGPA